MTLHLRDSTPDAERAIKPYADVLVAFALATWNSDDTINALLTEEAWCVASPHAQLFCWNLQLADFYPAEGGTQVQIFCDDFGERLRSVYAANYDYSSALTRVNPDTMVKQSSDMGVSAVSLAKMLGFHERVHAHLCTQKGHVALGMAGEFKACAGNQNYLALQEQIAMCFMCRSDWNDLNLAPEDLDNYLKFVQGHSTGTAYADFFDDHRSCRNVPRGVMGDFVRRTYPAFFD